MQRFRGGLVFKAHRRLYHSTLGLRVIKKKHLDAFLGRVVESAEGCGPGEYIYTYIYIYIYIYIYYYYIYGDVEGLTKCTS